ncbi:hypothetical protein, partial [uncultured Herbaspirillum sp.]|uniref:hypothetical protein n=1 Tax=uncultured Herbaspirillum sp. TaxID=160236 RepID=UPI00258D1A78
GKIESLRSHYFSDPLFTSLRRLAPKGESVTGSPSASRGLRLACGFGLGFFAFDTSLRGYSVRMGGKLFIQKNKILRGEKVQCRRRANPKP